MKKIFTFFCVMFLAISQYAQVHDYWQEITAAEVPQAVQSTDQILPTEYLTFTLNFTKLKAKLNAVAAGNANIKERTVFLPLKDGKMQPFEVAYSPVMHPNLAAKYPDIKSFTIVSHLDHHVTGRLEFTLNGFRAIVRDDQTREMTIIEPYKTGNLAYYTVYDQQMIDRASIEEFAAQNGWGFAPSHFSETEYAAMGMEPSTHEHDETTGEHTHFRTTMAKAELRTYEMALGCTGEYAQQRSNGTVAGVLSEFVTATNVLNEMLIRDLGVKMELIENTEDIIYLDPATDPFSQANNASTTVSQTNNTINNVIGVENFDVGHVFTIGCINGIGGVSLGVGTVCVPTNKAAGVTCHSSNNLTAIVRDIMAHEFGHQLGAEHTWNNCPPTLVDDPSQFAFGSAFEPGSGSTIMSYAGACGNQDIENSADPYYHVGSIAEIYNYTREGNGADCADVTVTENDEPEAFADYEDGFHIPINTPFELEGSATDENEADNLTYNWEQTDVGPVSLIGNAINDAPLFRSYPPTGDPKRIFPRIATIVNNQVDIKEALPDTTRNLTFRFTVRDNNEESGGIDVEEVAFRATHTSGPFLVTFPNDGSEALEVGDYVEITWDVANTDNSLVNCQKVNIKLSVDGGFTFPITLKDNTPNDGSDYVTIPNNVSDLARVRVEAADNIFFDISNANFSIIEPMNAGFAMQTNVACTQTCWPSTFEVVINTASLLDFNGDIAFDVPNLPAGATVNFEPATASPGSAVTAIIDMSGVTDEGVYDFTIAGTSDGADDESLFVSTDFVYNNFAALEALAPNGGNTSVLPDFSWSGVPHADNYEIEIATSPAFGDNDIVCVIEDIAAGETTAQSCATLDENTQYFWRLRPLNECGPHGATAPIGFQTQGLTCNTAVSTDGPFTITQVGTPTISSDINVTQSGSIDDLNLKNIDGQFDSFGDLSFELVSPGGGTTISLARANGCFSTAAFNFDLDDQAALTDFDCPPTGQAYQPNINPLSGFNGLEANGTWTLNVKVEDTFGSEGGTFNGWELEFCGSFSSANPNIALNETMCVNPGDDDPINENFLIVEDADNSANELLYTIVTTTTNGVLLLNGSEIGVGDTFTHDDIVNNRVRYGNTDENATTDSFTFTISDGNGGFVGTPTFNIDILEAPDCITNTEYINPETDILLYPNPATNVVFVEFKQVLTGDLVTRIFDAQGKVMRQEQFDNAQDKIELNTSDLPTGIYFISLTVEEGVFTKKVTIQ